MEGVSFTLRALLERCEQSGGKADHVTLTGGGARSEVWQQICADVMERPMTVMHVHESSLSGATALLSVGLNFYADVHKAIEHMVHVKRMVTPRPKLAEVYHRNYHTYGKLCEAVRELDSSP
jgi:xylulokinase